MTIGRFGALSKLLILAVFLTSGISPCLAQDAPAADAAPAKKPISSWVKLCDKVKAAEGKSTQNICIVHHERLDPNSGAVVISAALRKIEGQEKQRFMVTVPLGMALSPGMQIKIDGDSAFIPLKFTFCLPNGCTAETEASPTLVEKLSGGKTIEVATINALGEQIGFEVPLTGFKQTLEGAPIDGPKFQKKRKAYIESILKKKHARAKTEAQGAAAAETPVDIAPAQ